MQDEEVILVDPRRTAEYRRGCLRFAEQPGKRQRPLAEGRIKGARFSPWQTTLLGVSVGAAPGFATDVTAAVEEEGLRFKSKADLRGAL